MGALKEPIGMHASDASIKVSSRQTYIRVTLGTLYTGGRMGIGRVFRKEIPRRPFRKFLPVVPFEGFEGVSELEEEEEEEEEFDIHIPGPMWAYRIP